jgi:3-phenylpropionate/trans-cinnamate dioxygenase ferredoxin subunit
MRAPATVTPFSGGERLGMAASEHPVALLDEVQPGTTKRVTYRGEAVLLCNCAGEIYAIADECTHDGGELDQGELEDCRIMCPRHGAYFDVRTGAALTLPAVIGVRTYRVRLENGAIFIDG